MRAFLAVLPDSTAKERLQEWQTLLRRVFRDNHFRWTSPSQWHITLRFFDNFPEVYFPDFISQFEQTLASLSLPPSLTVSLTPPTFFPSPRSPRVLASLLADDLPLLPLVKSIESAGRSLGLPPPDHPFRGHLTLARLRNRIPGSHLPCFSVEVQPLLVNSIHFFSSQLTSTGPIYTPLHTFFLDPNSSESCTGSNEPG